MLSVWVTWIKLFWPGFENYFHFGFNNYLIYFKAYTPRIAPSHETYFKMGPKNSNINITCNRTSQRQEETGDSREKSARASMDWETICVCSRSRNWTPDSLVAKRGDHTAIPPSHPLSSYRCVRWIVAGSIQLGKKRKEVVVLPSSQI